MSESSEAREWVGERWLARAIPHRLTDWVGVIGLVVFALLVFMALFPAWLAPYDPTELVGQPFTRPNAKFVLGTNDIGQDLLSELIWSARISLSTGLVAAAIAMIIGTAVGLVAGYTSGAVGTTLMRLADLTLVLPFLPLVILLSAYLGPSQRNVIAVLALVSWAGPARIIRAQVLTLRQAEYVEAARAVGVSQSRILLKHIWPAVSVVALVQFVLVAANSILAEASLSFLGLGDPTAKSWGTMLYFAQARGVFLTPAWSWWVLPTGAMITVSILSLVLIGYWLEERLEPALRR